MKKILIVMVFLLLLQQVSAQEKAEQSATDLAKKTQNPVADLISVPFQYNTFFEAGPKAKTQNTLLIQPVIPLSLNDNWNFIARPIIPLIEQPPLTATQHRNHGLGNIQFQGFFSPKEKVGAGLWALVHTWNFPRIPVLMAGLDRTIGLPGLRLLH